MGGTAKAMVSALMSFLRDLVLTIAGAVVGFFVDAISAISVPDFIKNYSLGTLLGPIGESLGYFLVTLKIAQGFGLVGAGYVFRLARKFLTLFQW
jgi:hypothetical protein